MLKLKPKPGKNPPNWPIKVFTILFLIHFPLIVVMIATALVEGTLLAAIQFWLVTVPLWLLSILLDPLKGISVIIATFLVWYAFQFDWGWSPASPFDPVVRGRVLQDESRLRASIAGRRHTLRGGTTNSSSGSSLITQNQRRPHRQNGRQ